MNEFVKQLKVGDEVIIRHDRYCSVHVVEKITKAGNLKVNGILFKPNGLERGGDTYRKCILQEATPEAIAKIKETHCIQTALSLMRSKKTITYQQALQIIEILMPAESEGKEK